MNTSKIRVDLDPTRPQDFTKFVVMSQPFIAPDTWPTSSFADENNPDTFIEITVSADNKDKFLREIVSLGRQISYAGVTIDGAPYQRVRVDVAPEEYTNMCRCFFDKVRMGLVDSVFDGIGGKGPNYVETIMTPGQLQRLKADLESVPSAKLKVGL